MSELSFPLVPSLDDVHHLFETWRTTRQYKCPIPDQLWQAAVSLAPSYPLSTISKTLSLNYSELKKRVERFSGSETRVKKDEISFVELPVSMKDQVSPSDHVAYPNPSTLNLVKPSGERLSCTFYESVPEGLVSLVKAFVHHDR